MRVDLFAGEYACMMAWAAMVAAARVAVAERVRAAAGQPISQPPRIVEGLDRGRPHPRVEIICYGYGDHPHLHDSEEPWELQQTAGHSRSLTALQHTRSTSSCTSNQDGATPGGRMTNAG